MRKKCNNVPLKQTSSKVYEKTDRSGRELLARCHINISYNETGIDLQRKIKNCYVYRDFSDQLLEILWGILEVKALRLRTKGRKRVTKDPERPTFIQIRMDKA